MWGRAVARNLRELGGTWIERLVGGGFGGMEGEAVEYGGDRVTRNTSCWPSSTEMRLCFQPRPQQVDNCLDDALEGHL